MITQPIVILGGMGPQASVNLHQRILQKSRSYHQGNGDEFPGIVHFSLPIPDFISDKSKQQAGIATLQGLTPTIKQLNPACIALACNTAHLIRDRVGYLQQENFVSLIETVANYIETSQITNLGLLASPTTVQTKLYEHTLQSRNITVTLPDSTEQASIEAVIRNVIGMRNTSLDAQNLHTIASHLVEQGAQAVLLGCTELPLIFDKNRLRVPVFDCLDLYAEAIVEQWSHLHQRTRS